MFFAQTILTCFLLALIFIANTHAAAPSDSPHDADIGQSSYLDGSHNLDPDSVSHFTHLWNATFQPDEIASLTTLQSLFSTLTIRQHWARPIIHTLPSTGRQVLFTASNQNRVRTFDAATGELLNERQILAPWPMDQANCSELGKTMGIMGTPVVYTDYEDGIAFFYVKSYIE
jgi:hypothetical protein